MILSYMSLQQGASGITNLPMRKDVFQSCRTYPLDGGIEPLVVFNCLDLNVNYYGRGNRQSVALADVKVIAKYHGGDDPGTTFPIVGIYAVEVDQITLGGTGTWTPLSDTTPIQYNLDPLFVQGSGPARRLVATAATHDAKDERGNAQFQVSSQKEVSQGTSLNSEDLILSPGKTLYVDVFTPKDDYEICLTFTFVSGL